MTSNPLCPLFLTSVRQHARRRYENRINHGFPFLDKTFRSLKPQMNKNVRQHAGRRSHTKTLEWGLKVKKTESIMNDSKFFSWKEPATHSNRRIQLHFFVQPGLKPRFNLDSIWTGSSTQV